MRDGNSKIACVLMVAKPKQNTIWTKTSAVLSRRDDRFAKLNRHDNISVIIIGYVQLDRELYEQNTP